jgi:hypothetical protein
VEQMKTKCFINHANCSDWGPKPFPKRVLKFSRSGETTTVKLVEPPTGELGRYATLSHCWGPTQPIKTQVSNLAKMHDSIPFESLRVVFQQAIEVTAELGLEYIWIDSLCIVQDDKDDWEVEASKMCDYYENGFLNIATAASPNHGVPFLGETDPTWWPVEFEIQDILEQPGKSQHSLQGQSTSPSSGLCGSAPSTSNPTTLIWASPGRRPPDLGSR